jgi:3-phenylpropionate/trans-cinnamate dioxygenase ferredoxin reductase subunit
VVASARVELALLADITVDLKTLVPAD